MSSTIHSSEIESIMDGPSRTFVMTMDSDVLLDEGDDSSSFSVIQDDSDEDNDSEIGQEQLLSDSGTHLSRGKDASVAGTNSVLDRSVSKMGSSTVTSAGEVASVAEGGTKVVNRWRYLVFISLLTLGIALVSITNRLMRSARRTRVEETYFIIAKDVLETVQGRIDNIQDNVGLLVDMISADPEAVDSAFETVAARIRSNTKLEALSFIPTNTGRTLKNNATSYSSPVNFTLTEYLPSMIQQEALELFQNNHSIDHGVFSPMYTAEDVQTPFSSYLAPVTQETSTIGVITAAMLWDTILSHLLPETWDGVIAIVEDSCGQTVAAKLSPSNAILMENGDHHVNAYRHTKETIVLSEAIGGFCGYSISLYCSDAFFTSAEESFSSTSITTFIIVVFAMSIFIFCAYDRIVRRRHLAIMHAAARSNAIISSLFPTNFRDRLFEEADNEADAETKDTRSKKTARASEESGDPFSVVEGADDDDPVAYKGKPIADLFPETTILFADIAGFTAWSSVREPSQVFILLETLYHAFDVIAKQRGVFKVETVGDCYVAVTGLPEPRADHAVAMCRFAHECMQRTKVLTKRLEVLLGPDTADLAMRMGIHSGPVTAGVLRGERSRFQLFGDTMNTAARMEHNGIREKIQLSRETADLLIESGKTNWLQRREDVVFAKGKGEMQTYFLDITNRGSSRVENSSNADSSVENSVAPSTDETNIDDILDSKTKRLVGWNVDVLLRLLKQIEARRRATPCRDSQPPNEALFHASNREKFGVLDEIKEIIALPKFQEVDHQEDAETITLRPEVATELQNFVFQIAHMYKPNDFHNFEHASHVTMSVVKLLSRIVAPRECANGDLSTLHDHTYGITSDPLTQFACVLSALIHDADHAGVSNMQLVKEQDPVARRYDNKSVLEQNSIDLAWDLLMTDEYKNLRRTIYQTDAELVRFRQLLVNSVMATDISDKELKTLRNLRWERAFAAAEEQVFDDRDTINRKATIVIEHLIQASDVSHTMQHWHVYRKWNERFFMECYRAFKDGRAETDPSIGWYKGEIGFFDFYIIPLARKLKECGVFGVSSAEYLNYAVHNRQEWEARGKEVVDEMLEKVKQQTSKKRME